MTCRSESENQLNAGAEALLKLWIMLMTLFPVAANADISDLNVLLGDTRAAPYSETAPGSILSTFNAAVLGQLIKTDKNLDLVPGLLESWNWDFKTSEYVLKLQHGLVFHNGRPVTVQDLEFSLLRGFFSERQSFYRTYLSNVLGVEKIKMGSQFKSGTVAGIRITDNNTLRVKLTHPSPSFLLGLTGPYFSIVAIEALEKDYLTWKSIPIGAGPYRVASPFNDGVTVLSPLKKTSTTAKTVNLHTKLSKRHYDVLRYSANGLNIENLNAQLSELPASIMNLSFSNLNPDSKSLRFRTLVKNIVYKDDLVASFEELSVADEMLPKHLWGSSGISAKPDPELANKILSEDFAELRKKGIRLNIFSGSRLSKSKEHIVGKLQKQFAKLGIRLDYETSLNKFVSRDEAKRCQLFLSGMVADYIDPLVMFASLTKRGADPFTRAADDQHLEDLYMNASKDAQRNERIASLRKLSQYVIEMTYVLPLAEERVKIYYDPKTVKSLGSQTTPLTLFIENIEVK